MKSWHDGVLPPVEIHPDAHVQVHVDALVGVQKLLPTFAGVPTHGSDAVFWLPPAPVVHPTTANAFHDGARHRIPTRTAIGLFISTLRMLD